MNTATLQTRTTVTAASVAPCEVGAANPSRYRLNRTIGQGGMGVVYLATERSSGRRCALKVVRPEQANEPSSVRRFQYEIDVLENLSHPHVVRFLEHGGDVKTGHYFAMEYVAGPNLDHLVRADGALPSQRVLRIMRQICSALSMVHARGVVHNDIKPANLVLARNVGTCDTVKLIDFGLAQPAGDRSNSPTDVNGAFNGSPLYAPPESYSGSVDYRSDIYALGATSYHLLTGRPVFDEKQPIAAIAAHATREPTSIQTVKGSVNRSLAAIVMKCLSKNPCERYQSVAELDAALAAVDGDRDRQACDARPRLSVNPCADRRTPNDRKRVGCKATGRAACRVPAVVPNIAADRRCISACETISV